MRIIDTAELGPVNQLDADTSQWVYNGLDCCVTKEIIDTLKPMLDPVTQPVYDLSRNLQAPILEMSMRGILVNQVTRSRMMHKFRADIHQLESQLYEIVAGALGHKFNWRSPKQLEHLLYNMMNLPVQKKRNANGIYAPTTNREALEKLSVYFIAEPIINHLLLLRDIGKALGFLETGIDGDGRMRTSFNIAGTNTGRLASSESVFGTGTNLQNVARELREVFVADPGYKFANIDLEQADSRNIGANCWNAFVDERGEKYAGSYLDACEGGDLHTTVARMALPDLPWGTEPDRAIADRRFYRDKSYRDVCKVLGHGSNYLGTPPTMAKHSKLPTALVKDFQHAYFTAFPCIPDLHRWVFAQLKEVSYITTFFGRRRFFWGRHDDAATRREAVAYTGQSPTADAINAATLNLWRWGRVQLLIQVHDSLLFQYPEAEEDEILPMALQLFRAPVRLARGREFIIPAEAKVGWNWADFDSKNPDKNPDGLKKWKGHDDRKRQVTETKLNIRGL